MNENERDFKKVLESIKSLESQIIELNLYVREQIKYLLEENKKDLTYHINYLIFYPGNSKSIFFRQADMILKTFKID